MIIIATFKKYFQFLTQTEAELTWAKKMGAIHHARWMAAGVYALKMQICGGDRFKMSQAQAKGLLDVAFFILCIYGRYWFAAPVTPDAPFLTLSLWKDLHHWAVRDPSLSAVLQRKLDRHTWYLTGRCLPFVFWSPLTDNETKREVADALLLPENEECDVPLGKPDLPHIYPDSTLASFVTPESWFLFRVRGFPNCYARNSYHQSQIVSCIYITYLFCPHFTEGQD